MSPEFEALVATAASAHPRTLKSGLRKLASPLPPAERTAFYETACRALAAASTEVAAWSFTQARKTEEAPDLERIQALLVELVPLGAVAPKQLRDHARALSEDLPEEGHAWFREVVCAGFDAGLIPYARIFPDLRRLAADVGLDKAAEDEFLALRLLRGGLLPGAPRTIWAAAAPALADLAGGDDAVTDLLIEAEPDPGHDDAEKIRHQWLAILADAGAGRRLSLEWFATSGRACPAGVLLRLAEQGETHLFPAAGDRSPGTDPTEIPPVLPRWDDTTDAELSEILRADLESGRLFRLDRALTWLVEKGHRFRTRNPGFLREVAVSDPVDALLAELRTGICEEVGIPVLPRPHTESWTTRESSQSILLHGEYLTVRNSGRAVATDGRGGQWRLDLDPCPKELMPWFDGERWHAARWGDRWQNFLADASHGGVLTLEPDSRALRPRAPGSGEITFPGGTERHDVRLRDGLISVVAPDGTAVAATGFSPRRSLVPPPAAWGGRPAVDPAGSAWLRSLDRGTVGDLVLAVMRRRSALTLVRRGALVAELLPEISDETLRNAVARRLAAAGSCLSREHWLATSHGVPTRPPLSPILATTPDLPTGDLDTLLTLRTVAQALVAAAAEVPRPEPTLLRTMEDLDRAALLGASFEGQAARALAWLWPWHRGRARWLNTLRAWASTELGDGGGRWRLLWSDLPIPVPDPSLPRAERPLQVWRTADGALLALSGRAQLRELFAAFEYAPGGRFTTTWLPNGRAPVGVVPQSRIDAGFLRRLEGLRAENGPPPADARTVKEFADRSGLTTGRAASILYGDDVGTLRALGGASLLEEGVPADIVDLLEAAGGERPVSGSLEWHTLGMRGSGRFARLRALLMPDDPADLWTAGPDVARAADWWKAECERHRR